MLKDGWKKRCVSYESIHSIDPQDISILVESLEIRDSDIIADLMCGYGAVASEVLKQAREKGIGINLILLDAYLEQIKRVPSHVNCRRLIEDIRQSSIEPGSVDKAVIKMGLHELPAEDQQSVVDRIYRILKQGGILSVWDVMHMTLEDQTLFRLIISKKDKLAGFESFVEKRYFFRQSEIEEYLKNAGFNVEFVHEIRYRLHTSKRLDTEFGGDKGKLEEWNQYVREVVPDSMKERLEFRDRGENISMTLRKGIIRGKKK